MTFIVFNQRLNVILAFFAIQEKAADIKCEDMIGFLRLMVTDAFGAIRMIAMKTNHHMLMDG